MRTRLFGRLFWCFNTFFYFLYTTFYHEFKTHCLLHCFTVYTFYRLYVLPFTRFIVYIVLPFTRFSLFLFSILSLSVMLLHIKSYYSLPLPSFSPLCVGLLLMLTCCQHYFSLTYRTTVYYWKKSGLIKGFSSGPWA